MNPITASCVGELAGDINGLCAKCKAQEEEKAVKEKRLQALMDFVATRSVLPSEVSERERLLQAATQQESAMMQLARNMANPVRQNMDYQNIARRFIQVEPIEEEE
jgi:hypothetical protein